MTDWHRPASITAWPDQQDELDEECRHRGEGLIFIARHRDGVVQGELAMRGVHAHLMRDEEHGCAVAWRHTDTRN